MKSKSGLNVKHGITSEGVIDSGYTGSIVAKLYNNSDTAYTVKKGDTLWGIAGRFGVKLSALIAANPQIKNPNLIYPGDKVVIP